MQGPGRAGRQWHRRRRGGLARTDMPLETSPFRYVRKPLGHHGGVAPMKRREKGRGRPVSGQRRLHRRLGEQGVGGIDRGHTDPGNAPSRSRDSGTAWLVSLLGFRSLVLVLFFNVGTLLPEARQSPTSPRRPRHKTLSPGTYRPRRPRERWGSGEALCGPVHRPPLAPSVGRPSRGGTPGFT